MATKPPADPQSCASCRHFLANTADQFGYCRRYPPVASTQDGAHVTLWPAVTSNLFCGEYDRALNS